MFRNLGTYFSPMIITVDCAYRKQAWVELTPDEQSWTSGAVLTLTNGGKYIIQVGAVNGAGLTAVRKTNGVIVDITPPQVWIFAGAVSRLMPFVMVLFSSKYFYDGFSSIKGFETL